MISRKLKIKKLKEWEEIKVEMDKQGEYAENANNTVLLIND